MNKKHIFELATNEITYTYLKSFFNDPFFHIYWSESYLSEYLSYEK